MASVDLGISCALMCTLDELQQLSYNALNITNALNTTCVHVDLAVQVHTECVN